MNKIRSDKKTIRHLTQLCNKFTETIDEWKSSVLILEKQLKELKDKYDLVN